MLDAPTTNTGLVNAASDPADAASWQRLYATYRDPIIRHCANSGLTPAESEEIVQEVLAKLAQRLSKAAFNWKSATLRGWLNQTTNHLIFEVHRLNRRQAFSADALAIIAQWLPPTVAPEGDTKVREQLEAHLWSVCLARVRQSVRPRQWQIFECYALQDNPAVEVARRFNTTGINVRIIRHRMIARIRRVWSVLPGSPLPEPAE
jgi:RNA polymerase sigma factor (sigma-70 family)